MYVNSGEIDLNVLYQGDVIDDFPVFVFTYPVKYVARTAAGSRTFEEIQLEQPAEESWALSAVKKGRIMILSQTCDIEHRENVIITPVNEIAPLGLNADTVRNIKSRKVYYWFYLPAYSTVLQDSLADFQSMYYVPKQLIIEHAQNKILSLSDLGRHHLGWSLSNFFGRPVERL